MGKILGVVLAALGLGAAGILLLGAAGVHGPRGAAAGAADPPEQAAAPALPVWTGGPGATGPQVPVLLYHYVRVNPDPRDPTSVMLSVAPAAFAAQMEWLARHGYHAVTLERVTAAWQTGASLPIRPVVITLDDGYEDAFTQAAPVLRRHGFVATAFIVTGLVGQPGYMSVEQLRALQREGWEIGSHSMTHPDLTLLDAAALQREIAGAAAALKTMVGRAPASFAYPYGSYNAAVVAATQAAGYTGAVTAASGLALPEAPFLLSRLWVTGDAPLGTFTAALDAAG